MRFYKLLRPYLTAWGGFQWSVGEWVRAKGPAVAGYYELRDRCATHTPILHARNLCTNSWLHCYEHPYIAVLLNYAHADIPFPRLWEVEVGGYANYDGQLKCGFQAMRLKRELRVPKIVEKDRKAIAELCDLAFPMESGGKIKMLHMDRAWTNKEIITIRAVASFAEAIVRSYIHKPFDLLEVLERVFGAEQMQAVTEDYL